MRAVAAPSAAAAAEVVVFLLLLEAPVGQLRLGRRVSLVAVQLEELAEVVALQGEVKLVLIKISKMIQPELLSNYHHEYHIFTLKQSSLQQKDSENKFEVELLLMQGNTREKPSV